MARNQKTAGAPRNTVGDGVPRGTRKSILGMESAGHVWDELGLDPAGEAILKDPNKRLMLAVAGGAWGGAVGAGGGGRAGGRLRVAGAGEGGAEAFGTDEEARAEARAWFADDDARSPEELVKDGLEGLYTFVYIASELGFASRISTTRRHLAEGRKDYVLFEERECRACHVPQPLTNFHLNGRNVRHPRCRACISIARKQKRAEKVTQEALAAVVSVTEAA